MKSAQERHREQASRYREVLRLATLISLLAILFVGTLMPGVLKHQLGQQLGAGIPWAPLAHFLIFAAIATLPIANTNSTLRTFGVALLVGFTLAVCTELLQFLVPERHPRLRDIAIDLTGTLVGYGIRLSVASIAENSRAP